MMGDQRIGEVKITKMKDAARQHLVGQFGVLWMYADYMSIRLPNGEKVDMVDGDECYFEEIKRHDFSDARRAGESPTS